MPTRRARAAAILLVTICILTAIALRPNFVSEANNEMTPLAPMIGITKTVSEVAGLSNGDGNADPGETLEYTITVSNTGPDPATNVALADTIQNITTLVGGSVVLSPIAANDAYNAIGNVSISPNAAQGLLANDINPGGGGTLAIVSPPITSANGGSVTINTADGSFTYNPAPGFSGQDNFTYTLGNGSGLTNTATVTINVSTPIWFVNAAAGPGGDGRLSSPFNCFVGAGCFSGTTIDEAGDTIFLFSGSYSGGQTLLANQRVLGAGTSISLASFMGVTPENYSAALPATGGARPTVTTTLAATNGINLGSGNTLRGFNIGNTTQIDINGTSFGTVTISEMDLNGTGRPLNLTTGTLAVTFDSVTSTSATGGAGISLMSAGGTLTVSGATSITSAGGAGVSISGSSVAANFGASTSITTPTSQGILISTSTGNVSFGNTSISGGTDGISLQNNSAGTRSFGTISTTNGTGAGFLHAVGGATAVSGLATFTNPGTNCVNIQDSTTPVTFANVNCTQSGGTGIFLDDNSSAVTFADLDITPDAGQRGLHATEPHSGAITTTSGTISTTNRTAIEIVGTSAASRVPLNIQLTSVSALASGGNPANGIILSNTSASGSPGGFRILGSGGVCNEASPATCSGGHIQNTAGGDVDPVTTSPAGTGIVLRSASTISLTRIRINGNTNYGIHGLNVTGFTLADSVVHGVNGTNVSSPFRDSSIRFDQLSGTASLTNSLITGGFQHNLLIDNQSGTAQITVSGNTIKNTSAVVGDDGFQLEAETTSVVNAFVTNNSFSAHGGDHFNLSLINNADVDLTFTGNAFAGGHAVGLGQGLFVLGSNFNGTFNYDISNNGTAGTPLVGNRQGGLIHVNKGSGTASFNGRIQNNFIGNAAIVNSGSLEAFCIIVGARGAGGVHNTLIDGNTVRQYEDRGIVTEVGEGAAALNATITNNTVSNFADAVNSLHGIHSDNGILAGDTNAICMDIRANSVGTAGNEPQGGSDIRLRKGSQAGLTLRIPGLVGTTAANAQAKIAADNPTATTVTVTGANFSGGAACTQPTLPSAPAFALLQKSGDEMLRGNENPLNLISTPSPFGILAGTRPSLKRDRLAASNDKPIADKRSSSSIPNISRAGNLIFEIARKLRETIIPTVHAQDESVSPESGETVNPTPFLLPTGESVTIKFRVTLDNGSYASGVSAITNTANVTADGGVNVNSNQTSITLDAAPDLSVTKTEGGGTTQPGVVLVYTLSYSNITANNGQAADNVVLTETVPANTTFNAASSTAGWSCADGSAVGTVCSLTVGSVNAGAGGSATFALDVLGALPTGAIQVSNGSSIAEHPNVNGPDRDTTNDIGNDSTPIVGNWLGATSTDWHTAANWSNNVVPLDENNISIPTSANVPTVTTSDVTLGQIFLNGQNINIGLERTIFVTGNVALGGNIVDGMGKLDLGDTATITRTAGQVNSTLRKVFTATGPFTFPVGTASGYSPVDVNVTAVPGGMGQLTVKANDGVIPATIPRDSTKTLHRYWTVTGGGITADVTWNYLDIDVFGNESAYFILRAPEGGNIVAGFAPNGTTVILDTVNNKFTMTGMEVFSNWTVGEPLAPTAANVSVSGRVTRRVGNDSSDRIQGVSKATVSFVDDQGNVRTTRTNNFGFYQFAEVEVGHTYVFQVTAKNRVFAPQVVTVLDTTENLDFAALE